MKKQHLLKSMLLLCALVVGSSSVWADVTPTVLFHETFGDNSSSARAWDYSYSEKSGVEAVYADLYAYTVTNAKQSKNTVGSTKSGLLQTTKGTDASIIIGPLNARYENLKLTYKWNAGSTKETYTTKAYYATSSTGSWTEVSGTGTGATSFVDRSYSLPAAACVSTLYLKIVFNTSNTGAVIDEVELQTTGAALPSDKTGDDYTEIATINKGGTATSDGSYITTSGSVNTTAKYGHTYGLKFESSKGKVFVALPEGTTNARLNLLSSASGNSVNIKKGETTTSTPTTVSGNADDGFSVVVPIADSYAGSTIEVSKDDGSLVVYQITLTCEIASATNIYLETSANMAGWRAFYDASQAYTADENTNAYVADKDKDGSTITLKNIGKGIPSGVPVILKTSAGDHKIVLTKGGSATYTDTNHLIWTTSAVTNKYRLGYGASGVGFYPYSGTPSAGAVILDISSAGAHALTIDFEEGDVTSITEVSAKKEFKGEYFNLAGQRVDANHKGIVVVNGKKFFNK